MTPSLRAEFLVPQFPTGAVSPAERRVAHRHVAAAAAGNALEFYDFTTYAFFAAQIGRSFFPGHSPLVSLMLSLATFGAGYFTRPLGALVLGRHADRVGRRPAMMISFFMMGIATVAMALAPSYSLIGPAAGVIVVTIRLIQGFALGGEVGPATAFLLEAAPPGRRGLYTAMQPVSQNLASLVAGLVGLVLANLLSEAQIDAYGWRIALLIGALVLPFGLWARRSLPETLHEADAHSAAEDGGSAFSPAQLRVLTCSIAILVGGSVATAIQSYLTTYSGAILHMQIKVAFLATVVYGITGTAFNLVGAMLSDRIGRRPLLILPRIVLAVIILPSFMLLARNRDGATLALITAATTALASTAGGVLMGAITESLRKASRSTALALIYAATVALVGGTTQVFITFMIKQTGDILWPAYYYIAATLLALAGAIFIRESAPRARRAIK